MRGFTLLEVLIAFVIAATALGAFAQAGTTSLQSLQATARTEEALSRARSRLALALHGAPLQPGTQEGDDGGGFRWRVQVQPVASLPPRSLGGRGARRQLQVQTVLYAVSVELAWTDGAAGTGARRTMRLETRQVASMLP